MNKSIGKKKLGEGDESFASAITNFSKEILDVEKTKLQS